MKNIKPRLFEIDFVNKSIHILCWNFFIKEEIKEAELFDPIVQWPEPGETGN